MRLLLVRVEGRWVAVYYTPNHDYERATVVLLAWRRSLRGKQGSRTASQMLTLWHTTTPEYAQRLTTQGTSGVKPVGPRTVNSDYEPGRGMGKGLYLSRTPNDVFGTVAVPVQVREDELMVPPERAHRIKAGMTPLKSLNVGDGYTEVPLGPERFGKPIPVQQYYSRTGSKTADYNMAYYAKDWAWQDWLDRRAGGRGQHDLTKTRTMPLLMRLAQTILADHGHAGVQVALNRTGEYESEADYDGSTVSLDIGNDYRNKWTLLHEMAHGLDLIESGREEVAYDNHGPLFKQRFTSLLKQYGGPDGALVDLERRP